MILDGQQRVPRTISGYLDIYTSVGLPSNVDPRTFLFNVSKFNKQLPRNVGRKKKHTGRRTALAHPRRFFRLRLGLFIMRRYLAGIIR